MECQDRAEDSDRDGGNDDRADVAPKPDDENRGEGGFRQTVVISLKEAMEYGNSFSFIITFATFCDANDA